MSRWILHNMLRNLVYFGYGSVSDIGWRIGAQKGYFRCLGKRRKLFAKAFTNIYLIFKGKKKKEKKKKKKVVLYHFTAKFHIKAPALMHLNKGFPSLTKPQTPS